MKISIVTVARDAQDVILDALESVYRQMRNSYSLQHIVVDGGSTDGTVGKIMDFAARHSGKNGEDGYEMVWVSEPDNGLYDAMNKGVKMATGDIVGIVHADDMLASDRVLESVAQKFIAERDLDFVYSDVRFVDRDAKLEDLPHAITRRYICPRFWHPCMFAIGYAPPHPGQYIRKSCFEKWGYYNLSYKIGADYDMNLRFLHGNKAKRSYLRQCSVAMRLGGASTDKSAAGNFARNNQDVIAANKANGYAGAKWLIAGKLPIKALEIIVPKIFHNIGAR